jgi:hypothetical protein
MNASCRLVTESDRVHSQWRAWAADVRDSRAPYDKVSAEGKGIARRLSTRWLAGPTRQETSTAK